MNWLVLLPVVLGLASVRLLLPAPRRAPAGPAAVLGLAALLSLGAYLVLGFAPYPFDVTAYSDPRKLAEAVLFFGFSALAVVAAVGLVVQRNPARCAIAFAVVVLSVCGLFLLLAAPFLMAATIIIYAGAIIVTFLFVIMLSQQHGPTDANDRSREPDYAALGGFVLLGILLVVLQRAYNTAPFPASPVTPPPLAQVAEMERVNRTALTAASPKAPATPDVRKIVLDLQLDRYADRIGAFAAARRAEHAALPGSVSDKVFAGMVERQLKAMEGTAQSLLNAAELYRANPKTEQYPADQLRGDLGAIDRSLTRLKTYYEPKNARLEKLAGLAARQRTTVEVAVAALEKPDLYFQELDALRDAEEERLAELERVTGNEAFTRPVRGAVQNLTVAAENVQEQIGRRPADLAAVRTGLGSIEQSLRTIRLAYEGLGGTDPGKPISPYAHAVPTTRDGPKALPAGNVSAIGRTLYTDHLIAIELGGTLLLVATVGAIAIAGIRLEKRP